MAVNLDVIPTASPLFTWGALKGTALRLGTGATQTGVLSETLKLLRVGSNRQVRPDEVLSCPGYYYFGLREDSALSLAIEPTTGDREDVDYLADFGRNLSAESRASIQQRWRAAAFLATVSSGAGRDGDELRVLALIARAIAELTCGYVVVTEDVIFGLRTGIYTLSESALL